ncbi:N-succinyl-L,L-diaminopimelate desuccinylase [hydrothermal vent metagenome]|uniref:Succinyl-diaminopimelate desuccinylase n=1 Tax=hydrothermal vent metagenome TaxID=652676 RepID=A0A3B0T8G4_9ZZZZ
MTKTADPITLLQTLIRCPSVTPQEAGVLGALEDALKPAGFECTRLPFSADNTPDVDNLFARLGSTGPHLCFAGHVDVVPTGDEALWTYPPFDGQIHDGVLYGRGACDMKGSVAAFAAAAIDISTEFGGKLPGSVSMLITGDEEGPAINGTVKMLAWLEENGQLPDECLVGEPSCSERFGDTIKNGRRGSITFEVIVKGVQGHAAYPHLSLNPIPILARLIDQLSSTVLDSGTDQFEPSTLAVSTFDVGNPATNVTPERARAQFNIRFNTQHSAESLKVLVQKQCDEVQAEMGGEIEISSIVGAECFLSNPGPLLSILQKALLDETGTEAILSTGGGTSDARFIKNYCPVIEFGPINKTIHQVDERIEVKELEALTRVYKQVIKQFLSEQSTTA